MGDNTQSFALPLLGFLAGAASPRGAQAMQGYLSAQQQQRQFEALEGSRRTQEELERRRLDLATERHGEELKDIRARRAGLELQPQLPLEFTREVGGRAAIPEQMAGFEWPGVAGVPRFPGTPIREPVPGEELQERIAALTQDPLARAHAFSMAREQQRGLPKRPEETVKAEAQARQAEIVQRVLGGRGMAPAQAAEISDLYRTGETTLSEAQLREFMTMRDIATNIDTGNAIVSLNRRGDPVGAPWMKLPQLNQIDATTRMQFIALRSAGLSAVPFAAQFNTAPELAAGFDKMTPDEAKAIIEATKSQDLVQQFMTMMLMNNPRFMEMFKGGKGGVPGAPAAPAAPGGDEFDFDPITGNLIPRTKK